MAFHFRRSITIGGIRVHLSPSGISYSSSPSKAFAIRSGGSRNFDYQEQLSTSTGDASQFFNATSYRMITEINRRKSTARVAPIVGGMFVVVCLLLFGRDLQILGLLTAVLAAVATTFAAQFDKKERTTVLHYDLGDDLSRFVERQRICQVLLRSVTVWRVHTKPSTSEGDAETDSLLGRREVAIGRRVPPCIQTNIEVWCIDAGSTSLYFLPDGLFVLQDGTYSAISYESLTAHVFVNPFIERSNVPRDANIVGHTWKYLRADGSPDRWFNRQLPIAMYGLLILSSQSGFSIGLQCSNQEVAKQAAEQIEQRNPQRPEQPKSPEAERKPAPPRPATSATKSDYDMLQVSINATDEEITAAYIRLAQMYHPDKVEGLAPEYKVIANARMKEINDAFARLKSRHGQ